MRAFETEKTEVAEVDRSIYDIKDAANAAFEVNSGLTPEIVEKISEEKHDPEWMRLFRLKALETYNKMPVQNWGPSIEGLDMSNIARSGEQRGICPACYEQVVGVCRNCTIHGDCLSIGANRFCPNQMSGLAA